MESEEHVAELYDPLSELIAVGMGDFGVPRISVALPLEDAFDPMRLEQALRFAAMPLLEA